jgi:[ribosomal protein S5]-alanine N-acetyltransferase
MAMENAPRTTHATKRLLLRVPGPEEALSVLDFYRRNQEFLAPTDPLRGPGFFTLPFQAAALSADREAFLAGRALPLWIFLKSDPTRAVGKVALSQIVHGVFHSAFLGYKLDQELQGQGYATEAVGKVVSLAFGALGLHRIEAHVMPRNLRSLRLLERFGFEAEGYGPRYLKIHGRWEDHVHFALVKDRRAAVASVPHPGVRARGIVLRGERTLLRLPVEADLPEVVAYRERNRERLDRWNPSMPDGENPEASFRKRVLSAAYRFETGREADFLICLPDRPDKVVGSLTFRDITPMPLSCCELGYSIDACCEGRGYMHDAACEGLRFLFEVFGLHRVNASYMIANDRSARLLDHLGFRKEGLAKRMLFVGGEWQDMVLASLLREDFVAGRLP